MNDIKSHIFFTVNEKVWIYQVKKIYEVNKKIEKILKMKKSKSS